MNKLHLSEIPNINNIYVKNKMIIQSSDNMKIKKKTIMKKRI
jgi:hypothetical protein